MNNIFLIGTHNIITEANVNFYANPFIHPKRKMKEYDFIYILQGEWKIGQNNEVFELNRDKLLILAANQTHFGMSPCTEGTKTMYFHVNAKHSDNQIDDEINLDTLIDASYNPNIKRCFQNLVNAYLSGSFKKANVFFNLLLCELSENQRYTEDAGLAVKIKDLIHAHPEKFFSNKEIALLNNVSVKTAENKFKSMFGLTIHQYILNYKINEAISYFRNFPHLPIKQISYNLGFYDEYHFSKQFKKLTGLSPSQYRKNLKK